MFVYNHSTAVRQYVDKRQQQQQCRWISCSKAMAGAATQMQAAATIVADQVLTRLVDGHIALSDLTSTSITGLSAVWQTLEVSIDSCIVCGCLHRWLETTWVAHMLGRFFFTWVSVMGIYYSARLCHCCCSPCLTVLCVLSGQRSTNLTSSYL